jgi:hypothetical protein
MQLRNGLFSGNYPLIYRNPRSFYNYIKIFKSQLIRYESIKKPHKVILISIKGQKVFKKVLYYVVMWAVEMLSIILGGPSSFHR